MPDRRHSARGRADRILAHSLPEHGKEDRFGIGGAGARRIQHIGNELLDMTAQPAPVADEPVVHEHPWSACKRVAVLPRHRRSSRGADMGEEQMRADMPAKITQILVRPCRTQFAVKSRLRVVTVPAEAESVSVGARRRLQGVQALRDQRVLRLGDVVFECDRIATISDPAAHRRNPCSSRDGNVPELARSRRQSWLFSGNSPLTARRSHDRSRAGKPARIVRHLE